MKNQPQRSQRLAEEKTRRLSENGVAREATAPVLENKFFTPSGDIENA